MGEGSRWQYISIDFGICLIKLYAARIVPTVFSTELWETPPPIEIVSFRINLGGKSLHKQVYKISFDMFKLQIVQQDHVVQYLVNIY